MSCPLRYRYLEVEHDPEPAVDPDWSAAPRTVPEVSLAARGVLVTDRDIGRAVHRALHAWQRDIDGGQAPDADALISAVTADVDRAGLRGPQVDRALAHLRPRLAAYAMGPLPRLQTVALEHPATLRLTVPGLEIEVAIRVDRVALEGGGVLIIDFKTVSPHLAQRRADELQLRTYALARDELAPGHGGPIRLLIVDIVKGRDLEVLASEAALRGARAALERAARGIARERFTVVRGHRDRPCWSCGFRLTCPSSLAPHERAPRGMGR